jgi:hypothetical protein
MRLHLMPLTPALVLLAACVPVPDMTEPGGLPEEVLAIAAPGQDLSTARLLPEDNCFWYQHRGPVETTLLPLRNRNGRPICLATG